jgi:hypothetical protein
MTNQGTSYIEEAAVKSQKRLLITKRMMDNIASQHYREAARFELVKRAINYKTNE